MWFQPSPGAKAGCDASLRALQAYHEVSTLTRRESRVRRDYSAEVATKKLVSTLTRRESRVRPADSRGFTRVRCVSTLTRRESRVRPGPCPYL